MKKQAYLLLSAVTLSSTLLASCSEGDDDKPKSEPVVENQTTRDLDYSSQKELNKDKEKTNDKLKLTKSQAEEYENLKSDLPKSVQSYVEDNIFASINKYYFVKNYQKSMDTSSNYVVFVKDTDKFNNLYKSALKNFMKQHDKDTMTIYHENGQSVNLGLKNVAELPQSNAENKFSQDDFIVDEQPSFFVVKDKKIEGNFVGYYDTDNLNTLTKKLSEVDKDDK